MGGKPFNRLVRRTAATLSAAVALLVLAGCQTPPPAPSSSWRGILGDAAIADPSLPLPPLKPITEPRPTLVSWKRASSAPVVGPASFAWPAWVTVAGELRAFCQHYVAEAHPDSLTLRRRIERLLGMREGDGDGRVIVEFTIDSGSVFRPCPDPAIDTTSCPVEYDVKGLNALLDRDPVAERLLLQQLLMSYVGQNGYPFTRRGYTYDWDASAATTHHIGLSEYVTKPGASVEILSIATLEQYCAAQ
jgi:hypothetical protein